MRNTTPPHVAAEKRNDIQEVNNLTNRSLNQPASLTPPQQQQQQPLPQLIIVDEPIVVEALEQPRMAISEPLPPITAKRDESEPTANAEQPIQQAAVYAPMLDDTSYLHSQDPIAQPQTPIEHLELNPNDDGQLEHTQQTSMQLDPAAANDDETADDDYQNDEEINNNTNSNNKLVEHELIDTSDVLQLQLYEASAIAATTTAAGDARRSQVPSEANTSELSIYPPVPPNHDQQQHEHAPVRQSSPQQNEANNRSSSSNGVEAAAANKKTTSGMFRRPFNGNVLDKIYPKTESNQASRTGMTKTTKSVDTTTTDATASNSQNNKKQQLPKLDPRGRPMPPPFRLHAKIVPNDPISQTSSERNMAASQRSTGGAAGVDNGPKIVKRELWWKEPPPPQVTLPAPPPVVKTKLNNVASRIDSKNVNYSPPRPSKKTIENHKLEWTKKSTVDTWSNIKHQPRGTYIYIYIYHLYSRITSLL